ncbi:restriction endonuclease subunit S [Streptococcus thermophilus]|nr:restriction endonuclease subunit S [Streptococcus thermophilus]
MSEFKTYTLEQLCIVGSSKRVHLSDYVQHGVPFYRSKEVIEISSGKNISEQLFISSEKYSEIKSKFPVPQENDVLITAVGTIGEILVVKDPNFYFKDGNLIWLRNINFDIIDIDYLYYFFKSDLFQKTIKYNNIGAVQKALTIDFLKTVKITLPSLDNQRKLVSVLKSIDKKIQINNQINQELEAMAKTLYDYWFVQFDFPDQNGKPYKSSGGKMVYNPELKREIPEGWGVEKLENIANITMGQSPKGTSYNEVGEGMLFFQGSTDFGWRFPVARQYTTEPSRIAEEDDILLSVRAPVGTLNIADTRCCIGRGLAAINSKVGANSYIFNVMQDFKKLFDMMNSVGTTFGSITKDDLYSLQLIYPPNELLMKFDKSVNSFDREIKNRSRQNQELSQLRDWLLPMLMNGQVKVE